MRLFRGFRAVPLRALSLAAFLAAPLSVLACDSAVTSVSADPHHPGIVYATVRTYRSSSDSSAPRVDPTMPEIYRSVDGGSSWEGFGPAGERIIPSSHRPGDFYAIRRDSVWRFDGRASNFYRIWPPDEPTVRLGVEGFGMPAEAATWRDGLLYLGIWGHLVRSEDGGATWDTLHLPSPADSPVSALGASSAQPGLVFAVKDRRLYRSGDGGDSWAPISQLAYSPILIVVHPADPDTLMAGAAGALLKSTDGGRNWRLVWSLGEHDESAVLAIVFESPHDGGVYAAVRNVGILASVDGGETWRKTLAGDGRGVAVSPPPMRRVFAAVGSRGVYRNRDLVHWPWLGEWEPANFGFPPFIHGYASRFLDFSSWLFLLSAAVLAGRSVGPTGLRSVLRNRPEEGLLGVWSLASTVALLMAVIGQRTAEEQAWIVSLVSVTGAVSILLVLAAPSSWVPLALLGPPEALSLIAAVGSPAPPPFHLLTGLPGSAGLVLSVAGLCGSVILLAAGRRGSAKVLVVLTFIPGNLPYWLFGGLALFFDLSRAF